MDIFWLKDESLKDSNLPESKIIAKEIGELESVLQQFATIHEDLVMKDNLMQSYNIQVLLYCKIRNQL